MTFPKARNASLIPVAEYLRMSTTVQDQSIDLQRRAISEYAGAHGLEVVRSYIDDGKSGLRLKNRAGLQELLKDVQAPAPGFSKVLVYDVGRWGRFQDADEAAYYEFHCRMNDVDVVYVAESFKNDGSLFGALVKSMKRAMAAEYSRELSLKVRAGQEKIVREGYSASHNPHLGYRRQVVSADLRRCIVLEPGERKSVQSERIRVVLGPRSEQVLVRRIFRLYSTTQITIKSLVDLLNGEGHPMPGRGIFSESIVRNLLSNGIYVGKAVWGVTTSSLGNRVPAPLEKSVCLLGIVPPLIDERTFERVQNRLARYEREVPRTLEQMLQELAVAVKKFPKMTSNTMAAHGLASRSMYANKFGSLAEAYKLIGHVPVRNCGLDVSRAYEFSLRYVEEIATKLIEHGAKVTYDRKHRSMTINRWKLGVLVVLPVIQKLRTVWPIVKSRATGCDLLLIVRLAAGGKALNYYLMPSDERKIFPGTLYGADPESARRCEITDIEQLALIRM